MKSGINAVIIPFDQLSPEALSGVIEEFVTRESTDYGDREFTLEQKINQVSMMLKKKKAVIVYDTVTQSSNILPSNDPVLKSL